MTRQHRPALAACLLAVVLLATPVTAAAQPEQPDQPAAEQPDQPAHPEQAISQYQQGMEATYRGDYEVARSHLEAHLAADPGDAVAILALARVEFWTNRFDQSIALYDQYLQVRSHDIDAKIELAHTLFWAGDLIRTEQIAREAVAVEPENIQANLVLAAVLQTTDRDEEADAVYNWILKLDPENVNAKNRRALTRAASNPGDAFVLSSRNYLNGDNFDFIGFKSTTGLAMGFFGFLTVEPRLLVRIIDDPRVRSPITGVGPGLKLGVSTGTPVSLWVRGAYVPMVGKENTVHGWSTGAGIDVELPAGLNLWGAFNTELHGLERQSALAVSKGFRRYEGLAGLYYAKNWFRLVASGALGEIYDRGQDLGLNMTWWLSPAFRVHDGDWTVFVGYGLWGMVYQNPAPPRTASERDWWDPAAALSHTIYVDLEARVHEHWKMMANLGGGLAQERSWSSTTKDADWTTAGLVNGRLALGWTPSAAFEARLGSGFGVSSRRGSSYTSWNVLLDLIGRW